MVVDGKLCFSVIITQDAARAQHSELRAQSSQKSEDQEESRISSIKYQEHAGRQNKAQDTSSLIRRCAFSLKLFIISSSGKGCAMRDCGHRHRPLLAGHADTHDLRNDLLEMGTAVQLWIAVEEARDAWRVLGVWLPVEIERGGRAGLAPRSKRCWEWHSRASGDCLCAR